MVQETLLGNLAHTSSRIFMLTIWSTRNIVLRMCRARSSGPDPGDADAGPNRLVRVYRRSKMATARHARSKELESASLEQIMDRYVARYADRRADWAAFEDAKIEGFKRAQHRFIGAGGSGKHNDVSAIPPGNFTLSIMFVPPGQGNAAHTHEVEEVFFVLQGHLDVFVQDEDGRKITRDR